MTNSPVIRVMIVDDHPQVRRGLCVFLELWDDFLFVGEADNGEKAVALVEEFQPHVILMDLVMPVMHGVTATRIIRQHQGLPLGAELPDLGDTVAEPTPLVHDGHDHVAYPDYHPDQPHFFGGGQVGATHAPAGYYKTPFWKKASAIKSNVLW